jgi:hypothetical protein
MGHVSFLKKLHYNVRYHITECPASRRRYRASRTQLTDAQHDVARQLECDGVASVPIAQLFADRPSDLWQSLSTAAEKFASSSSTREAIAAFNRGEGGDAFKSYVVRQITDTADLPAHHPLVQFGLSPVILAIVNSYLGMFAKLHSANFWYTIPTARSHQRTASQRWHRDPEDFRLVKVFLYFTDVDEAAGPLEYIPESRLGRRYAKLWRFAGGTGVGGYPPQDPIEREVPLDQRRKLLGNRGTVVFCDTSGLHRGGFATDHPRILATWTYVTPASLYPRNYRLSPTELQNQAEPIRYAAA